MVGPQDTRRSYGVLSTSMVDAAVGVPHRAMPSTDRDGSGREMWTTA